MAEQKKPAKLCIVPVRNATLELYRFPDDGRMWKHSARNRQALAVYLSSFANGDGSRIFPSVQTMAEHFGTSRATMFRWLSDLRALNLLNKKTGLHGERGAAIRSLNVDTFVGQMLAIKAAFLGVSKSGAEVSNSEEQESQTQEQESQSREQESHHGETQPPSLPPNIPPPPPPEFENGGGGSSLSQEQATIDARYLIEKCPKLAFGKETELAALIQEHGMPVVNAALFRCSKESFDGVRNPVAVVFSVRLPKMIAEMKADHDAVLAKKKTQERIDADIQKQIKELDDKGRAEHVQLQKEKAEAEEQWKAFEGSGNLEDIL